MNRKDIRQPGQGYRIKITQINDGDKNLSTESIEVDNISNGGFRFTAGFDFELEDRLRVVLTFPNNADNDVLGRICYSETVEKTDTQITNKAYGFSILEGFYEISG